MSKIISCRACTSTRLEPFLDLGSMPLAGGFLPNREAIHTEDRYPLQIDVCHECSLVQITTPIDPEILFQNYSFSSSTIKLLVQHFENYAQWIKDKFSPSSVVEFGCNDGILLTPLKKLGIHSIGVDVSENIIKIAQEKGLHAIPGYFNLEIVQQILNHVGSVDVVTGSNAFAHNHTPEIILESAKKVLSPNGVLCLEVMYAVDLIEQWQWDTLYHEHLTFYSFGTLQTLLKRNGFSIIHAERLPMHGGSIRVVASVNHDLPMSAEAIQIIEYESKLQLNHPKTWMEFGKNVHRKINIVKDVLGSLSKNSRIWGYGAAGKATMWVNACEMNYVEAMIDSSPLRAGKLMPGTHTPIVFPDQLKNTPPDYIFITAWNYAMDICSKEKEYHGIWVTPLPELRMF